jgi:hypothetical protein
MFEQIDAPELRELQQKVASLEQERNEAEARAAQLRVAVRDARDEDLMAEAVALNRGRKPPKPKEPELKAQLEGAERRLEVLQRRLALAQSDVSKYVQAHHEELLELLDVAQRREAAKVAEGAKQLLADLGRYYKCEEDVKAMRPMLPQPERNQEAQALTSIYMGLQTTQNVMAGPERGEIEQTLAYLAGLAKLESGEEREGAA